MSLGHGAGIVRSGLILYLDPASKKSYSGSGTAYVDLSRTNIDSTLTGGVTYSTGNSGMLQFDGTTGYVDCGTASQIGTALTGLTVSVWIYSTSQSVRCIAENGTAFNTNTFYMFQENSSYFTFEVYGTTSSYDVVYADYVYQLNTWYNLVGTWQSGSRTELYTNGVLTSGVRTGGTTQTTLRNGNANLNIGNRPGNTTFRFSGNMGSTAFYNRALSAAEIAQNFNATRGRYGI
jgi:hypothetical protein